MLPKKLFDGVTSATVRLHDEAGILTIKLYPKGSEGRVKIPRILLQLEDLQGKHS